MASTVASMQKVGILFRRLSLPLCKFVCFSFCCLTNVDILKSFWTLQLASSCLPFSRHCQWKYMTDNHKPECLWCDKSEMKMIVKLKIIDKNNNFNFFFALKKINFFFPLIFKTNNQLIKTRVLGLPLWLATDMYSKTRKFMKWTYAFLLVQCAFTISVRDDYSKIKFN